MPTTAMPTPSPSPRPLVYGGPNIEPGVPLSKLRKSCDECHKSKVKCFGTLRKACPRCLKLGRECRYSMSGRARRRRPGSRTPSVASPTPDVASPVLSPADRPAAALDYPVALLPGHLPASPPGPMQLGVAALNFDGRSADANMTKGNVAQPTRVPRLRARTGRSAPSVPTCRCFFNSLVTLDSLEAVSARPPPPFNTIMGINGPALKTSSALLTCDRCLQLAGTKAVANLLNSLLTNLGSLYVAAGTENVAAAVAAADPALASSPVSPTTPTDSTNFRTAQLSRHLQSFAGQVTKFKTRFGYLAGKEGGIAEDSVDSLQAQVAYIRRLLDWGMPAAQEQA